MKKPNCCMCGKDVGKYDEGKRVGHKTVDFLQERYDFCSDDCVHRFMGELYPAEVCDRIYNQMGE